MSIDWLFEMYTQNDKRKLNIYYKKDVDKYFYDRNIQF